jgi:hypothetical protein
MERVTEYFEQLLNVINTHAWVIQEELAFRQIDVREGYIKGILYLHDGFVLHVAEYVEIQVGAPHIAKYRYHLQDHDNHFIARWDNAPHHQHVSTYPFHKHVQNEEIVPAPEMNILQVLDELDKVLGGLI